MQTVPSHGLGAVAAGHELTAAVGARVLEEGGNAADAVVAMVFAGAVCEGTLTSLGGGGFVLVGGTGVDEPVLIDCFARQPGADMRPRLAPWESFVLHFDGATLHYGTGPASVAVPGLPRGLAHVSRRFGRRTLEQVTRPAAELAQEGVALTRTQAAEHAVNAGLLARDPEGRDIYLVDGAPRELGATFRQPAMAAAIEELAASACESLYVGELARRLIGWSDARGARISAADLAACDVRELRPLELRVGDVVMYANPSPAMGGVISVRLLEAMLGTDHRAGGASGARDGRDLRVGRALMSVLEELDPPLTRPPEDGELVIEGDAVPEEAARLAGELMAGRGMHVRTEGDGTTPRDADGRPTRFASSPNTTHVSAIDGDGMVAGATTTVGYGSGEFVPGTGIQLNNMLAEYDHRRLRPPGASVPSMMTPALLRSPRTLVQIGSAGSDRIPHAISQVLERMWAGADVEEAILAPRFSFDGRIVHAEPGLDERALEQLSATHEVVRWPACDAYFGTTNGTCVQESDLQAVGDPRRQCVGIVVS